MTNADKVEEAMGLAAHHAALAAQHQRKSQQYMEHAMGLLTGGAGGKVGANVNGPRCLRVWADYLSKNGPSLRQEIQDATGVKFTERATPYTVMWDDGMAAYGDDHFAHDTIVRMRSVRNTDGRAGTSTAYFLWSQRYDVRDRFGVGPTPEMARAMTGVIQPPTETEVYGLSEAWDSPTVVKAREAANPEPETVPDRFATMEEWHARWDPVFDEVAPYEAVPTDEEKEAMRETLPEGENWVEVLAVAYQEAKLRSSS